MNIHVRRIGQRRKTKCASRETLSWRGLLLRRSVRSRECHETTRLVLAVMTLFVLDAKAGPQEQLEACRQQIDSLDQRIVELVQQRARVVEEGGKIKREAHLPVTVPSREQQVNDRICRISIWNLFQQLIIVINYYDLEQHT